MQEKVGGGGRRWEEVEGGGKRWEEERKRKRGKMKNQEMAAFNSFFSCLSCFCLSSCCPPPSSNKGAEGIAAFNSFFLVFLVFVFLLLVFLLLDCFVLQLMVLKEWNFVELLW